MAQGINKRPLIPGDRAASTPRAWTSPSPIVALATILVGIERLLGRLFRLKELQGRYARVASPEAEDLPRTSLAAPHSLQRGCGEPTVARYPPSSGCCTAIRRWAPGRRVDHHPERDHRRSGASEQPPPGSPSLGPAQGDPDATRGPRRPRAASQEGSPHDSIHINSQDDRAGRCGTRPFAH